jgi:tRNA uridine 5-carbamoylmethylation protein Kti12
MINTKLILLEGLPGSGKSTISKKLYDRITVNNKHLVQESSKFHPISENDIADIDVWKVKTLRNWEKLCLEIDSQQMLYVMEFVLFQNTIVQMLLKNCDRNQIGEFCHKIENIIKNLSPVLVLYTANNPATFLGETYQLRGDEWKKVIDHLIDDTPYGKKRNLIGYDGFMYFFDEYVSITNAIYDEFEIARICIDVTKREWLKVEKQTYEFLQI